MMKYSIDCIQDMLQKTLKQRRFQHTLGVQYTSMCLGMKYGIDLKDCELAGLLHDCAKEMNGNQLIEICENHGESISSIEYEETQLLHGKAGACLARDLYGIEDEQILNAIRFHTTGRPNMTLLEKIVFVADYIEPNRNQAPNLMQIRKMAFTDLDQAMVWILNDTLDFLEETNKKIDGLTVQTRDYYVERLRRRVNE